MSSGIIELWSRTFKVGLPVPIGSCKYDIQQLFNLLKKAIEKDCFKYFPGRGCTLPLATGHYGTGGPLKITLPKHIEIPSIVKEFLDGGIKIHASILTGLSEDICIDTKIYIDL